MIFHRSIPLFLSALAPLTAASFPLVPASARVMTVADVKSLWLQALERQRSQRQRRDLPSEIMAGDHDLAAQLVCLSHNVHAWESLGNREMAKQAEEELVSLRQEVAGREGQA